MLRGVGKFRKLLPILASSICPQFLVRECWRQNIRKASLVLPSPDAGTMVTSLLCFRQSITLTNQLRVCSFHTFFFLQDHLYHQKTSFVNSFRQKVVLVASYVCLASRGRQKWYSWYLQDISLTSLKNAVKTLLLRVPHFSIPFGKNAVLIGYFVYITLHYYALLCKQFRSAAQR